MSRCENKITAKFIIWCSVCVILFTFAALAHFHSNFINFYLLFGLGIITTLKGLSTYINLCEFYRKSSLLNEKINLNLLVFGVPKRDNEEDSSVTENPSNSSMNIPPQLFQDFYHSQVNHHIDRSQFLNHLQELPNHPPPYTPVDVYAPPPYSEAINHESVVK